jgi:hypothetical protein
MKINSKVTLMQALVLKLLRTDGGFVAESLGEGVITITDHQSC